jgi:diguanylate cyclase (GGDEF)-like protein/PAS domain S-box-containing protein
MRLRNFIQPRLYLLPLLVLSLFATAWLVYNSILTADRHHQALDVVDNLTTTDTRLTRAALEARMAPLANYDILNSELNQMRLELGEAINLVAKIDDPKISRVVVRLQHDLETRSTSVDDFRRDNAIVKNSLQYFPHVIHGLILAGEHEKEIPRADLAMLSHIMLLYLGQATPENRAQLDLWLTTVKQAKSHLSKESARKLDLGLSHARNIRDVLPRLDKITTQLTSSEISTEFKRLHDQILVAERTQQNKSNLLFMAFVFSTLFMAIILLRVWRRRIGELNLASTVFDASPEGIMITDAKKKILNANPAFCKTKGYLKEELIGLTPNLLKSDKHPPDFYQEMWAYINKNGHWNGEIMNRNKAGNIIPEWVSINAVLNDNNEIVNYVAVYTDLLQRYEAEEKIRFLANHDPLTSLPNRRLLLDRLKQALAANARTGKDGALLFIDLDHFKTLNDSLGHGFGDLLLQQVAARLTVCVRESDTVARLGGDEYVIMLEDLSESALEAAEQAKAVGDKILAALNQPYQLNSQEYRSTASIGVALFSTHGKTQEDLMKHADIAMYHAKQAGRNGVCFFDPQMQKAIHTRIDLEYDLRKALENQQFQMHYQIQVDDSGYPIGAEALIRWDHPERGLVSPLNFISLAEDTGLILPIGQWVLETACAQLESWQQNALTRNLTLSINVSAKQFYQADFVAQVNAAVQHYGINPIRLKLELTESLLLDNTEETIIIMNSLKELGILFSLDDFGTGYSSLQYLKRLPLYQLKIDRSFVRDIVTDNSDQAIVRTIIAMAHTLNLNVIAEGVETEEQQLILQNSGCKHFQGYLFGKPEPIKQFQAALETDLIAI